MKPIAAGLLLAILFLPLSSLAIEKSSPPPADPLSIRLSNQALARIKNLSRPVFTYNWASRQRLGLPPTGPVRANDARMRRYVKETTAAFWRREPTQSGDLGNGFYVATDAVASRAFGGPEHWALVQLILPEGFRFLDVRSVVDGPDFDATLVKDLAQTGCPATSWSSLLHPDAGAACREITLKTLRLLGVEAILYAYNVAQFQDCPERTASAFLLLNSQAIPAENLHLFVADIPKKDPQRADRQRIAHMFQRTRGFINGTAPWPELISAAPSTAADIDFATWARRSVFSCGTHGEDRLPSREAIRIGRFADVRERARRISQRLGHEIDPLRIREVAALRFVNRPDWEDFVARGGTDPREVYAPRPLTWDNWQRVAEGEVARAIRDGAPLSVERLLSWNLGGLTGTVASQVHAGMMKQTLNYGRNVSRRSALSAAEVAEIRSWLGWTGLTCQEDLPAQIDLAKAGPAECQQIAGRAATYAKAGDSFWSETARDLQGGQFKDRWYWYACWPRSDRAIDPRGPTEARRFCGMVHYPAPENAQKQLPILLAEVNEYFEAFARGEPVVHPVQYAARVQRILVGLHPFDKGNGRVSRWVMDYVSLRAGYPPILVRDMDHDLSTSEAVYEQEAIRGAAEAQSRIARCLDRYEREGFAALQATSCGLLTANPF